MLEERLQELERRKKELLEALGTIEGISEKTQRVARDEIEVNAQSVQNYIRRIYQRGFDINPDLTRKEETYHNPSNDDKTVKYREACNRMCTHLAKMRKVVEEVNEMRNDWISAFAFPD